MAQFQYFKGGTKGARDKLNEIVDFANAHQVVRGDEVYIAVRRCPGGFSIALNINQVLARIPKVGGAGQGGGCSCQFQGQVCGAIVDLVQGCFYPQAISVG